MTAPTVLAGATGEKLIAAERRRQVRTIGYTPSHDRLHNNTGQLLAAARVYETPAEQRDLVQWRAAVPATPRTWPWGWAAWKPRTRADDLVRAGALYLAEADRLRALHRLAAVSICEEGHERCVHELDALLAGDHGDDSERTTP